MQLLGQLAVVVVGPCKAHEITLTVDSPAAGEQVGPAQDDELLFDIAA